MCTLPRAGRLFQAIMLFDFTPLQGYFRHRSAPGEYTDRSPLAPSGGNAQAGALSGGFLHQSSHFIVKNSPMYDFSNAQLVMHGHPTLDRLLPYTCPEAAVDSSARIPPPKCHPGTREKVKGKISTWFHDPDRTAKAMWLYGPAGTGKSAVAQTIAEICVDQDCLGAAFFFSRPNGRNKAETVVPTIAYQLATSLPPYRSALTKIIADDITVLEKTPRVQLKKLIIEPFSALQRKRPFTRRPLLARKLLLIVLDGLDECEGLDAQLELVEMIEEFNRVASLPFLWLICSRPDPHLMYIFSRSIECNRHQLSIDTETRKDAEKYLRDGFTSIQQKFFGTSGGDWPSPDHFQKILDITDGLFVLGHAILGYIGNPTFQNPTQRLLDFLAFMEHADRIATDNPLETLDLLYSRILMDISPVVMPTTRRILQHCLYDIDYYFYKKFSSQVLANFL
ncbi:hypothetical protein AN958_11005 [Leucoagaricus sp. SymC.cos]|nr:hypothetical protein AN958_11005 [Leucoagaricus sp. SymC.cos]